MVDTNHTATNFCLLLKEIVTGRLDNISQRYSTNEHKALMAAGDLQDWLNVGDMGSNDGCAGGFWILTFLPESSLQEMSCYRTRKGFL